MEQKILQDVSHKERLQYLKDSCVKQENFSYPRNLSQEELALVKHSYSQNAIVIETADNKLKKAKEIHKTETKSVKELMSSQITKIRTGIEEVNGPVYLMDDQESGMMGYYNDKGELVYSRMLLQDERQLRILTKTGTKS